ncbi:gastrula zinc finger protein XlCGF58.1 isoform X1 [Hydra vulgaris]|uniref:gastrula zinc finger protein XlCGF58.1 isoform X1 n=1 Tax=Hydra vulgaris TaxID=6087 RepID=UPI0006411409|nr:gastrula zinc finger protein XlCGF58.1 [Hydra vulgaris]
MACNGESFSLPILNPLEGTRFAVEKITDTFLGQDSKIYYKVRWQETWEPEERLMTLCAPLVNDFWKNYYAKTQKQHHDEHEGHRLSQFLSVNNGEQQVYDSPHTQPNTILLQHDSSESSNMLQQDSQSNSLHLSPSSEDFAVESLSIFNQEKRATNIYLQPRFLSPNTISNTRLVLDSSVQNSLDSHEQRPHKSLTKLVKNIREDLICFFCQIHFLSKQELHKHELSHHSSSSLATTSSSLTLSCLECGKKFDKRTSLSRHMLSHTSMRPYVCEECGKGFKERSNLKKHQIIHTGIRPHACSICNARFRQLGHLLKHKLVHKPDKPFKCDVCFKAFKRKEHLKEHTIVHSEEFPFKCDTCEKKFRFKTNLKVHLLQHNGRKDFVCNICHKEFTGKPNLVQHQLIHNMLFSYSCEVCQKKFKRKGHLQRHMEIHNGQSSMQCVFCDESFFNKSSFKKHLLLHTGSKPFICTTCEKRFSSKSCLSQHMKSHTEETLSFSCDQCNKFFKTEDSLKKHSTLIHFTFKEFKCSLCQRKFKKLPNLEKHEKLCKGQTEIRNSKIEKVVKRSTDQFVVEPQSSSELTELESCQLAEKMTANDCKELNPSKLAEESFISSKISNHLDNRSGIVFEGNNISCVDINVLSHDATEEVTSIPISNDVSYNAQFESLILPHNFFRQNDHSNKS